MGLPVFAVLVALVVFGAGLLGPALHGPTDLTGISWEETITRSWDWASSARGSISIRQSTL